MGSSASTSVEVAGPKISVWEKYTQTDTHVAPDYTPPLVVGRQGHRGTFNGYRGNSEYNKNRGMNARGYYNRPYGSNYLKQPGYKVSQCT